MKFPKKIVLFLSGMTFVISAIIACRSVQQTAHPSKIDFTKLPLKTLSEYGFYQGKLADLSPNEGVLEYEPAAMLFTDYAHKLRFVWMPADSTATVSDDPNEPLNFPLNTILVKNFYYPADFAKPEGERRIIETRLLVNEPKGWKAYPYVWNDEQTEATYKVTGGIKDVHWTDEQGQAHDIKYAIPNKNQCKSCHNQNDKFKPIGPKVKQLNYAITYPDGSRQNQLEKWQQVGYLKGYDASKPVTDLVSMNDPNADLGLKARSYLDVNCSHCHSRQGPASTSGLYLNIEENDPFHWGVKKSPVAAGIGAGTFKFDILPGHGNESIVTYRMNSTNPGVMMPEIGRVTIHKEGVELVREWIDSLN